MSENQLSSPEEDPRQRFRRLLDEAEKAEQEAAAAYDFSEHPTEPTIPPGNESPRKLLKN